MNRWWGQRINSESWWSNRSKYVYKKKDDSYFISLPILWTKVP